MLVYLLLAIAGWVAFRAFAPGKAAPARVERWLREEARWADDVTPEVDENGRLVMRIGVAARIAREVKMRFGGIPSPTEANRLLCARYIADACADHGITRKVDQYRVLTRARPLVFLPLADDVFEVQLENSGEAQRMRADYVGWRPGLLYRVWPYLGGRQREGP